MEHISIALNEWVEKRFKPERYDPFEVFKPSKTYLKLIIKDLKDKCDELIKQKNQCRSEDERIFILPALELQHQKLLRRIKDYSFRLDYDSGKSDQYLRGISSGDIERARTAPIQDFYEGSLKKAGGRMVGRCPFHNERTGSFVIYPEGRGFHCFGCQAHGDSIDFIMKLKGLKFPEAVKYLIGK